MKKREASTANSGITVEKRRRRGNTNNLTPWRQGQSGNPAGRPSLKPITDALREVLEETDPKQREKRAKVIARKLVMKAQRGDLAAASFVMERVEGKAVQPSSEPNEEREPLLAGLEGADVTAQVIAVTQRLRARIAARAANAGQRVPE